MTNPKKPRHIDHPWYERSPAWKHAQRLADHLKRCWKHSMPVGFSDWDRDVLATHFVQHLERSILPKPRRRRKK